MFIEHRTYTVKPGRVGEYLNVYGSEGWAYHGAHAPCIGHYYTEAGDLFRIISMWRYESFEDRLERRAELNAKPEWRDAMAQIMPLVTDLRSNLLVPTPCWNDDTWLRAIYADIDAMNLDGFLGALSDDVELTFGNHPAAHGTAQARAAVGSFWASIGAIKHHIGTISREGDRATVEAKVEITRKDGRVVSMPSCSVIDRRGGKVTSMRTYVDLSPVSAA